MLTYLLWLFIALLTIISNKKNMVSARNDGSLDGLKVTDKLSRNITGLRSEERIFIEKVK